MSIAAHVEKIIDRKKAGTYALLQKWAGTLEGHAKLGASWRDRTAHARQGLHAGAERSGDKFTLYLSHGMEYGEWLEKGTPPHVIRPKNKKALYWKGAKHPVKLVHHPGTKPYPIVGPTMEAHVTRIKQSVLDWWTD